MAGLGRGSGRARSSQILRRRLRRSNTNVQRQEHHRNCAADNIDNGVHAADFMEVDLFNRFPVNTRFGLGQEFKCGQT